MGVDSRGKERGECQECDCSDYEIPDRGNRCSYCDCAPTKHQVTKHQVTMVSMVTMVTIVTNSVTMVTLW